MGGGNGGAEVSFIQWSRRAPARRAATARSVHFRLARSAVSLGLVHLAIDAGLQLVVEDDSGHAAAGGFDLVPFGGDGAIEAGVVDQLVGADPAGVELLLVAGVGGCTVRLEQVLSGGCESYDFDRRRLVF